MLQRRLCLPTQLPSPASPLIGNDLLRFSTVLLSHLPTSNKRCVLPLRATFSTKAVWEGKSSSVMREWAASEGEIAPEQTGLFKCHKHRTHFTISFDRLFVAKLTTHSSFGHCAISSSGVS